MKRIFIIHRAKRTPQRQLTRITRKEKWQVFQVAEQIKELVGDGTFVVLYSLEAGNNTADIVGGAFRIPREQMVCSQLLSHFPWVIKTNPAAALDFIRGQTVDNVIVVTEWQYTRSLPPLIGRQLCVPSVSLPSQGIPAATALVIDLGARTCEPILPRF